MSAGKLLIVYGASIAAFFAVDLVWLLTATPRIYKPRLGDLLAEQPKLAVAAGFNLLYVVAVVALAVVPGLREEALTGALWRGALLGLIAYATYDLTNLATIRDWPWQIAAIDIVWGTALTTVVTAVGYFVGQKLGL